MRIPSGNFPEGIFFDRKPNGGDLRNGSVFWRQALNDITSCI